MSGLDLNIGSSVLKREAKSADKVKAHLQRSGWNKTGSLADGRISYFQKSGINITVVDGPMGTVVAPSGPIRGKLFGSGVGINTSSVLGMGKDTSSNKNKASKKRQSGSKTIL